MNDIYETEMFSKIYNTLDGRERSWINGIKNQIKKSLDAGKILRFEWFREKKFGNKRLYYLISKEHNKALLLSFASKKEQQKVIDEVIRNKKIFLNWIKSH